MATLRKPRALRPGDTIGIATPASPVDEDVLEAGEALVRGLGFEPKRGSSVTARQGYLAGDDDCRAGELTSLVEDPDVRAILCARGGYGCQRIVGRLDPALFRKAAKPLIGYSDITTLLLWQRRATGLVGVHGPMLEAGESVPTDDHRELARALTGVGEPLRMTGETLVGGWQEGRLTGGSLSLVVASLGTPWEIDTRGGILLLEEVGEAPYRIDRMLQQLHAAGKLTAAAGIGVGQLIGCDAKDALGPTAEDVIEDLLGPLGVPTVVGLPFGHGYPNRPWPHGGRAAVDAERGEIELLEFPVARR
jgi:muramoyltetrapeptide carboxypeptidase